VKNKSLWLLFAWRVNDLQDSPELTRAMEECSKAGWHVDRLKLKPLDDISANEMVSDLLKAEPGTVFPLTALIKTKTGASPFFIKQFVQNIYEKKFLNFQSDCGWSWDESEIGKLQVTDNLVDLMSQKITRLPEDCRGALKIGACIGNRFDLSTLAAVMDTELETLLKFIDPALRSGLLQFAGETCTFSHDRLREAAYGLLQDSEKAALHSKIGWHVYGSVSDNELQAQAFYIANHLNSGWAYIKTGEQKRKLAMLNFTAGKKAREAAAYHSALVYLRISISLLDPETWRKDYRHVLAIYTEAAKAAYLSARFGEMERYVSQVVQNAVSVLDTIDVREIQIQACLARRMIDEAVETTRRVLSSLGVRLVRSSGVVKRKLELWSVNRLLESKTNKEILEYSLMGDPFYLGAMRIAKSGLIAFYIGGRSRDTAMLVLQMVRLSFKRGLCPQTPYWLAAYSVLLFSLNRMPEAFRFGDLALKMADQPGTEQIQTRYLVNSQILHWRDPVRQCCKALQENQSLAIEMGDIEYSAYCALQYCHMSFGAGLGLEVLSDEAGQYSSMLEQYGQMVPLYMIRLLQQVIDNLMGRSDCPTVLRGASYDETIMVQQKKKSRQRTGLFLVYTYKLMLCYLFGEVQNAHDAGEKAKRYLDAGVGLDSFVFFYFYRSLNILSGFAQLPASGKKEQWFKVEKAAGRLRLWALHGPRNHLFKKDLVEAEMARVKGHLLKAEDYYRKAINHAEKAGFVNGEALACELAGLFYKSRQMDDMAGLMLKRSIHCYKQWGASAKASRIADIYPELIKDFDKSFHDNSSSQDKSGAARKGISLDLSTVVKAFQAVSGEIVLEKLLIRLMQIGLEYAGAQRGVMFLNHQGRLYAEAEADASGDFRVLKSLPFEKYSDASAKIVSYVYKTMENVILDDACGDERFFSDPYVISNYLRSVLCAPIRRNKEISGIFYAENNLTTGAFSRQKMELLTLLSTQAAIAIENSRLFEIARRDGLTGLINHRYFRYSLEKELSYAAQKNHPVSLLMLDIDHFKDFNDTYGHQAGDAVLSQVAGVIQAYSADPDLAGRYGGEEFAIICPAISFEDARSLAEKIRRHIEFMVISYQDLELKVTISIGVATTYLAGAADSTQLIGQADKALYTAKASGRNRVAV
jgi:diguanylate cyclase (GGDEF)-like protein